MYALTNAPESDIYREINHLSLSVTVMRAGRLTDPAKFDPSASPTAPDLASRFQHGRDLYFPDHTHFLPMESPELVAAHARML